MGKLLLIAAVLLLVGDNGSGQAVLMRRRQDRGEYREVAGVSAQT